MSERDKDTIYLTFMVNYQMWIGAVSTALSPGILKRDYVYCIIPVLNKTNNLISEFSAIIYKFIIDWKYFVFLIWSLSILNLEQ